jgi:hypothetical protein
MFIRYALAFLLAAKCGGADTSKFIGTWAYQPGSTITFACNGTTTGTIDLSTVMPGGQPGFYTMANGSAAGVVHEVDGRGCNYDWNVSGSLATASPNQSCATFPDGKGGNQTVHMQSGTKSTSDGSTMTVDVHFVTDSGCTATVQGTTNRRNP